MRPAQISPDDRQHRGDTFLSSLDLIGPAARLRHDPFRKDVTSQRDDNQHRKWDKSDFRQELLNKTVILFASKRISHSSSSFSAKSEPRSAKITGGHYRYDYASSSVGITSCRPAYCMRRDRAVRQASEVTRCQDALLIRSNDTHFKVWQWQLLRVQAGKQIQTYFCHKCTPFLCPARWIFFVIIEEC